MSAAERAREWLRFAEDDLRAAEVLRDEGIFNEVCFHPQQCAEKMLKALLVLKDKPVPRTHRLIDLLEEAIGLDAQLEFLREPCLTLDQYYIPTRYPDAVIGSGPTGFPTEEEAEEAVALAKKINHEIRARHRFGA